MSFARPLGAFLLIAGAAIALFAFFIFDPSVSVNGGRVNNIGRLSVQQNMLLGGGILAVLGLLLALLGPTASTEPSGHKPSTRELDILAALRQNNLPLLQGFLDDGSLNPAAKPTGKDKTWLVIAQTHAHADAYALLKQHAPQDERVAGDSFTATGNVPQGAQDIVARLESLGRLRERGMLSQAEFDKAKAVALSD